MQQVQQEQIILPIGSIVRNVNGDRYTVEGLLGEGGSGAVYLVRDRRNKEDVFALKEVIDPDKLERERFAFEAEVLMRLDHDALPHVYRVFENERLKRVYILMDYIEGQDLEALRKEQPNERFPLHLVLALLTPIVAALNYLHHREPPIIHRDIKPANIVVPMKGGEAVLVDFGIAKEYTNDGTTTVIRHGSPGYAALEQYGGGTNIRTDVYGLGATLYTLLTGVVPVDALTRVTDSQGIDSLKSMRELAPELPVGVSNAIDRALSIRRDNRFATVNEFWQELNAQAEGGDHTTEKIATKGPHTQRLKKNIALMTLGEQRQIAQKNRRRATLLSVLGALLAFLLVGAGTLLFISHMPRLSLHRSSPITSHAVVSRSIPIATSTIDQTPYPTLASSYEGESHDLMNGKTSHNYLTSIQQNKSTIHGFCKCLGIAGPFEGTVGIDGSITFTVKIAGRDTGIVFVGHIKTGGDMAGEFNIITVSDGQHTGEYGVWTFV